MALDLLECLVPMVLRAHPAQVIFLDLLVPLEVKV